MAGESAGDYAQRLREKAARLERSAAMWERGAEGEATTAAALNELSSRGWTTFHDVRWPGRQRANIDHIAVGPAGVFVIDSKNWSGNVHLVDGVLYQGGWRKEREVAAAADAALAVTQYLKGLPATPVLCFVRDEPLDGWARDVMVCSTLNVAARLSSQPPVLGPDSIRRVTALLQWHLTSAAHSQAAVPTARAAPRQNSRRPRVAVPWWIGSRMVKAVCGLVLIVLAVVAGLSLLGGALNKLDSGLGSGGAGVGANGTTRSSASVPKLGEAVQLPATSSHPALRLNAEKVVRLRSTRPEYPIQRGQHLVGVRYAVRNLGAQLWGVTSSYIQFTALASNGQHAQHGYYSTMQADRLMPGAFNLRPGHIRRGYVVFTVPNGVKLVRVSVSLNNGMGGAAEWLIP